MCKFGSTKILDNGGNGNDVGFVLGNDVCWVFVFVFESWIDLLYGFVNIWDRCEFVYGFVYLSGLGIVGYKLVLVWGLAIVVAKFCSCCGGIISDLDDAIYGLPMVVQ